MTVIVAVPVAVQPIAAVRVRCHNETAPSGELVCTAGRETPADTVTPVPAVQPIAAPVVFASAVTDTSRESPRVIVHLYALSNPAAVAAVQLPRAVTPTVRSALTSRPAASSVNDKNGAASGVMPLRPSDRSRQCGLQASSVS